MMIIIIKTRLLLLHRHRLRLIMRLACTFSLLILELINQLSMMVFLLIWKTNEPRLRPVSLPASLYLLLLQVTKVLLSQSLLERLQQIRFSLMQPQRVFVLL